MLIEYNDIIEQDMLPKRGKYLRYYLLGIVDGEGSFSISVKRQNDTRFGWVVDPIFKVVQHKKNRIVLELLKRVLNCGRIVTKYGQEDIHEYIVDNRRHLKEKVLPFFRKYKPIIKRDEFILFSNIVEELERGNHKDAERFKKLIKMVYQYSNYDRRYKLQDILHEIDTRQNGRLRGHTPGTLDE